MLILLPQILFLLLWSTLDTWTNVRFEFVQNRNLMAVERCKSKNTIALLLLYLFTIMIAVVILAFKSSKIRYKNFKDAKATNAFTFF